MSGKPKPGKHRRTKIRRKIRRVTGQCTMCLTGDHHYGRRVRGCSCSCSSMKEGQ